jgi:hypothetical protein
MSSRRPFIRRIVAVLLLSALVGFLATETLKAQAGGHGGVPAARRATSHQGITQPQSNQNGG